MTTVRAISLTLLMLVLSAPAVAQPAARAGADFTFINRGEVGTLDPNRMSWLQDIRLGYAIWEGLYSMDPQTLEPIPGTAEKIDVNADKTVWTFHIRPTAKWHNGDAVKSGDFLFAWRRMLQEPGDYTYLLHYIKGAKALEEAFAKDPRCEWANVGIETPDDKTLKVTLEHPVTFFPDLVAFPPFFPLHEASMQKFKVVAPDSGRVSYDERWTRSGNLVGNGPFRLADWQFKQFVRLEASDQYWDKANVKSKSILMLSADDPSAAFLRYEAGGVHWLAEVIGKIGADLRDKGRKDLKVFPGFGTYFYSVNCLPKLPGGRDNPMKDARVRKALGMAINRGPIVKNITKLGEEPATNFIPVGIFKEYKSPKGIEYDVKAAKALLAEAGFADGKNFPSLKLLYNTEGQHADIAEHVKRQWQKNLGIDVTLEGVEINTFRQRLHNKDYDIARASWIGDYNDPSTFTDKYLSESLNNDSGWKNARYDELCRTAAREADLAKRLRMLEEAEGILLAEAPILPAYYYVNAYLIRDGVSGIALHPRNMVMFKAIEAKK